MLFITGTPRSGKTTFCHLIKQKYPHINILSSDALLRALSRNFPQTLQTPEKIAETIADLAVWNEVFNESPTIVDVGETPLADIYKTKKPEDTIICLGFGGDKDQQQIWELISSHHQEYDYTFDSSPQRLSKLWGDYASKDAQNYTFCKLRGIKYLDTSTNREEIFKKELSLLAPYLN